MRIGVKVKSIDVEGTRLLFETGSPISVDLIIAADGVQSVARSEVTQTAQRYPTASTGHNAFRFMIPKDVAQNDSVMKSVFTTNARFVCWSGQNKRILVYPVDYDRQYNITCTHPQELSDKDTSGDDAAAVGKCF